MNKLVKNIELTFENMDYIEIPNQYFSNFSLENIETNIRRVAVNAIMRYQKARSVIFELRKEANEDFENFDRDMNMVDYNGDTLFDRIIDYNDIVDINLIYEDDSSEKFAVEWDDECDDKYKNKLQISTITENGNLCVQIQKLI